MRAGQFGVSMLLVGLAMSGCSSGSTRADTPAGEWRRVDTSQTLSFAETGRISGDAGCNRFSGAVQLDADNALRIGPVMSTKRGCADAGMMRLEAEYLRSLDQVDRYRFESPDRLILTDVSGNPLLTFERTDTAR